MLKKLIKYDFKSTRRIMLPLYLILLFLTVLAAVATRLSLFEGMLAFIPLTIKITYELALVLVLIITYVVQAVRYYTNMVTDEGYLTFTLPVQARELTLSKLVTAVSWTIASMLLSLMSLAAVFYSTDEGEAWQSRLSGQTVRWTGTEMDTAITAMLLLIMLVLASVTFHLFIYSSIAVGQSIGIKNRVAGAFLAGISIYMVILTVMMIVLGPVVLLLGDWISEASGGYGALLIAINGLFQISISIGMYKAINHMFSKRLNLE